MGTVMMLEDLGYHVIEARGGAEALGKLADNHVDLLITDQRMPNMSGTELVKAARQLYPELSAILATGYIDLPKEAEQVGVPKLEKPFSLTELQSMIHGTMASKV